MDENKTGRQLWDESFEEQIACQSYNTAPVEAVIRSVSYYLRDRYPENESRKNLHFLEMGCGAGPNLVWLAGKGIKISGVDISPIALNLARKNLEKSGFNDRVGSLVETSAASTPFEDKSFDGIIEACVFQHLDKKERTAAFAEIRRLLKPGGVFVGYMLDAGHTVFKAKQSEEVSDDPGTLLLNDGSSKIHLTNLGLCHFFKRQELIDLFPGFTVVDPCLATYYLPREEAKKRGYEEYLQSMWTVYAIR